MDLKNELSELKAEKGIFKGGFTTLSPNQLDKLKGGMTDPKGGNGSSCTGDACGNCGRCA